MKGFGRIPQFIYLVGTDEEGEMIGEFHRDRNWAVRRLKDLMLRSYWKNADKYKIRKYQLIEVEDDGNA